MAPLIIILLGWWLCSDVRSIRNILICIEVHVSGWCAISTSGTNESHICQLQNILQKMYSNKKYTNLDHYSAKGEREVQW